LIDYFLIRAYIPGITALLTPTPTLQTSLKFHGITAYDEEYNGLVKAPNAPQTTLYALHSGYYKAITLDSTPFSS